MIDPDGLASASTPFLNHDILGPDMRILDYRTAVANGFKTLLPELKDCGTHGGRFNLNELKRYSVKLPALFVAVLGVPGNVNNGDDTRTLTLSMAAYLLAGDVKGLPRDRSSLGIVDAVMGWLPARRWGMSGVGLPEDITATNLYDGEIDRQAVALWGFSWKQSLIVESSEFEADTSVLPDELYASWVPEIGLAHKDDYQPLAELLQEGDA